MQKGDTKRIQNIMTESLTILLKNLLAYETHFRVEALCAITLDSHDEFHFSIDQTECAAEVANAAKTAEEDRPVYVEQSDEMAPSDLECMLGSTDDEIHSDDDKKPPVKSQSNLKSSAGILSRLLTPASGVPEALPGSFGLSKAQSNVADRRSTVMVSDDHAYCPREKKRHLAEHHVQDRDGKVVVLTQISSGDPKPTKVITIEPDWVQSAKRVNSCGVPIGYVVPDGNRANDRPRQIKPGISILKPIASQGGLVRPHITVNTPSTCWTGRNKSMDCAPRVIISSPRQAGKTGLFTGETKNRLAAGEEPITMTPAAQTKVEPFEKDQTGVRLLPMKCRLPPKDLRGSLQKVAAPSAKFKRKLNVTASPGVVDDGDGEGHFGEPAKSFTEQTMRDKPGTLTRKDHVINHANIAQKILLFKGTQVSITKARQMYKNRYRPSSSQVNLVMTNLMTEGFGTASTWKGNPRTVVFTKKPPDELQFPIEKYSIDKRDYENNYYV